MGNGLLGDSWRRLGEIMSPQLPLLVLGEVIVVADEVEVVVLPVFVSVAVLSLVPEPEK